MPATLDGLGAWLALAGFGAYHGLNPGMGWLFALALALQQQRERAIIAAVLPIAIGHAASLGLVVLVLLVAGVFLPSTMLRLVTALVLLGFGLFKLATYSRHPRWVGMRVSWLDLVGWSFLMATAHGAGLMIAPLLVGLVAASQLTIVHSAGPGAASGSPAMTMPMDHTGHSQAVGAILDSATTPLTWVLAIGVHTLALLLVMTFVAWIVYRKLGVAILRRGWINFDLIWAIALIAVGGLALMTAR